MTAERDTDSCRCFLGFGDLHENNAERRLWELWGRLLESVRSEEALAESSRGPRTGWNPYRPARGKHLQQSILNSEVYEWRSKIHVDSLYVVGTAIPIDSATTGTTLNPLDAAERHGLAFDGVANMMNESSCYQTAVLFSEHPGALCGTDNDKDDDGDRGTDVVINESSTDGCHDYALREMVNGVFDFLWRTVAVPWIMQQLAGLESQPSGEKEVAGASRSSRNGKKEYSVFRCASRAQRHSSISFLDSGLESNCRRPKFGLGMPHKTPTGQSIPVLPMEKNTPHRVVHRTTLLATQRLLSQSETSEKEERRRLSKSTGPSLHSNKKPALFNRQQDSISKTMMTVTVEGHMKTNVGYPRLGDDMARKSLPQRLQRVPPSVLHPPFSSTRSIRLNPGARLSANVPNEKTKDTGGALTLQPSQRKRLVSLKTSNTELETPVTAKIIH